MNRRFAIAIIFMALCGCSPATRKTVQLPRTPAPPPAEASTESVPQPQPLSVPPQTEGELEGEAEVVAAEVPTPPTPAVDEPAIIIAAARLRFEQGTQLYSTGLVQQGQAEVDGAIAMLTNSSAIFPGDSRIPAAIDELGARKNAIELAAIREDDEITDEEEDPAAIDDLADVPTVPPSDAPETREAVEAEVRSAEHDLPIEINSRVLAALDYFQNGRGRNTMAVGLQRAGAYRPMIEQILKEEGVPLDLIYLAQVESAFLTRALSKAKARGLWQFISSRGKEYGLRQNWWIDERSDPEKSTRAAARHLSDLYMEFNDWYLAMAAYNAGPVRVQKALKKTGATTFWELADKKALPKETIKYVPTILAITIIGNDPKSHGFDVAPAPPLQTERVALDQATDFRVISEKLGISVDDLRDLNPHVLRWTTPPDDPEFEFVLPAGLSELFFDKVASLPENERILWRYHNVRKGDTLSAIARKYGVSVNDLTQVNKISAKSILRIGQELVVPISGVTTKPVVTAVASTTKQSPVASTSPKPPASAYVVKRGDTLTAIAAKFSLTVGDLQKWNRLTSTRLDIGQRLSLVPPVPRQAN